MMMKIKNFKPMNKNHCLLCARYTVRFNFTYFQYSYTSYVVNVAINIQWLKTVMSSRSKIQSLELRMCYHDCLSYRLCAITVADFAIPFIGNRFIRISTYFFKEIVIYFVKFLWQYLQGIF